MDIIISEQFPDELINLEAGDILDLWMVPQLDYISAFSPRPVSLYGLALRLPKSKNKWIHDRMEAGLKVWLTVEKKDGDRLSISASSLDTNIQKPLKRYTYPNWGDGSPVSSRRLKNGFVVHTMQDGRKITVSRKPSLRIDYQSTWMGAKPGDTYEVNISIIGPSSIPGYVDTWNHDIGELRSYAYHKILFVTGIDSGEKENGAIICELFKGEMLE